MGNASLKARGHKHIHNNTRRHNKRFRRTRHYRHNRGGGLNPDKSVTRKARQSRPGFSKSMGLERAVVLGEARKAETESKRLQSLQKVNAEGSRHKMSDYITDIIRRYEADLYKVKQDGYALKYIEEQTPEICLAGVQNTGYALKYVKKQTPEVCLAAVKHHGMALEYVKKQTPEICLAAVQKNGWALAYVFDLELKDKIRL